MRKSKVNFVASQFLLLGASIAIASAQDLSSIKNKTILYTMGESGAVYISQTGKVYWTYNSKSQGGEFKIGQTIRKTIGNSQNMNSATFGGNTLRLEFTSDYTYESAPWHTSSLIVITFQEPTCQMTWRIRVKSPYGNNGQSESSESCRVVPGNQMSN